MEFFGEWRGEFAVLDSPRWEGRWWRGDVAGFKITYGERGCAWHGRNRRCGGGG